MSAGRNWVGDFSGEKVCGKGATFCRVAASKLRSLFRDTRSVNIVDCAQQLAC